MGAILLRIGWGEQPPGVVIVADVGGYAGVVLRDAVRPAQPTAEIDPSAPLAAKRSERAVGRAGSRQGPVADWAAYLVHRPPHSPDFGIFPSPTHDHLSPLPDLAFAPFVPA